MGGWVGERREECLVPGNRPNISVDIDAPRGINVGGTGIRVIPIFRDRCITTNGAPSFSFRRPPTYYFRLVCRFRRFRSH